jgi:hypothetical protein
VPYVNHYENITHSKRLKYTVHMKRRKSGYVSLALAGLFMITMQTSCSKKDNNSSSNNTYKVSASADGNQEVPAVTTSGTGSVTGTYDANTKILQYNVSWSNLSGTATAAHFHGPAAPGSNATVVVPFTIINNGNSGTATGRDTLTAAQETDFLAGKWYFNVHTAAHPSGEIRGQGSATK